MAELGDLQKQGWTPAIRALAKWLMVFGVFPYALWILIYGFEYHGIFKTRILGGDFINYWSAARLVLEHRVMTVFDLYKFHEVQQTLLNYHLLSFTNWSYPPFLLLWIFWLGFFPYSMALALWLIITFAAYAFAVIHKRPMPCQLLAMLFFAPATFVNFDGGQNGFLSGALLVGGLRLLATQPALAGIMFGLLSYKPQLGLLIPFALIAAREWRAFFAAAATVAVLFGMSFLAFGVEPWTAYFDIIVPRQREVLESNLMVLGTKILGTGMRPSVFTATRILGASLPMAYGIAAFSALLSVLAVVYAFRRTRHADLRAPVLLTAVFLTSPYIYDYDMTLFAAGLVATASALGSKPKAYQLILLAIAWLLPVLVMPLNTKGIPVCPLVLAGMLALQLRLVARGTVFNLGDRDAPR